MTTIESYGELLASSTEDLTLTYLLLPYGQVGHTNVGSITASKGVVDISTDVKSLVVNEDHDFKKPIGYFDSIVEDETGLTATVRLIDTQAGRDAHTLATSGLRKGISVEIAEPLIRNGNLMAGRLTGAGLVVRPAFENALLTAADCGETLTKESTMESTSTPLEAAEAPSVVQAAPIYAADANLNISALTMEAVTSGGAQTINAALSELKTTDDAGKSFIGDQEVGTLWEAHKVDRPLINAIGIKPLNSLFVTGTKRTRDFAVADWAGNLVELPTGKFSTSRENWQAERKAVAVDVAMELVEFGGEDVITSLYDDALGSFVEQTEAELVTYISAEATVITAAYSPIGAVNKAAAVLGAIGARMDFVAVSTDVFSALQEVAAADAPWWLANQGSIDLRAGTATVGGITLTSNQSLPLKTVLVGDSRAVDYRESKEFKVRAVDVAHGGVLVNFIKLNAQKVTDKGAILKFTNVA